MINIKTINNHCVMVYTEKAILVYSYDTLVIAKNRKIGLLFRCWNGYSATTFNDIKKALESGTITKARWDKMEVVNYVEN